MKLVLLHAFPLDERMWEPQLEARSDHETFTCALAMARHASRIECAVWSSPARAPGPTRGSEQPERFNEVLLGFLADWDLGLR